jgi:hypothetical protein
MKFQAKKNYGKNGSLSASALRSFPPIEKLEAKEQVVRVYNGWGIGADGT